jgi:hypothetical protein
VLHVTETELSKRNVKMQKAVKVFVRILADNNWRVSVVFTDGDSCTSPVHRIGFALREAVCEMLAQLRDGADPTEARITSVTLGETQQLLHTMGVLNGHGVYAADFVHFLRGCVTRLFDEGHTVKMTSAGPEITQEAIRERVEGTLVVDLFDATQFNQKILVADRHERGGLAERSEKSRRCLAPLSNDQLVRLGSILVVMAERLAQSVDCDVGASLEGTKRLEQESRGSGEP